MAQPQTPSPPPLPQEERVEPQALKDQVSTTIDEARMVLPGIQALFGFQLIVVFEPRFQDLVAAMKVVHFASLCLVVTAIVLIMTPAAYDRLVEMDRVSSKFVRIASMFTSVAMGVLAVAIVLDVYLVAIIATDNETVALTTSIVAAIAFAGFWFVYPFRARAQRRRRPR